MKDELVQGGLVSRLEALADLRDLPARAREQCERLLERIESPVRVAVLGPRGIGKSQLLGALMGRAPDIGRVPASDGGVQRIEADGTILDQMVFFDVTGGWAGSDWAASTRRAIGQADIVIWCTQAFDLIESDIWARVSDDLKDHSFLVLTQVGSLADAGQLELRLERLRGVAMDEFHSLFATETGHLAALLRTGAPVDPAVDVNSGVRALRQALLQQVDSGRRAWQDAAYVLLDRHGALLERPAALPPVVSRPLPLASVAPAPRPEVVEDAFRAGLLSSLQARIDDLGTWTGTGDAAEVRLVLDHCLETCDALAAALADHDAPEDALLREDVLNAADKMLLMAMEDGAGPAADAVTILLQLRRALQDAGAS